MSDGTVKLMMLIGMNGCQLSLSERMSLVWNMRCIFGINYTLKFLNFVVCVIQTRWVSPILIRRLPKSSLAESQRKYACWASRLWTPNPSLV